MDQYEKQLKREADQIQMGRDLYRRAVESKGATELPPGQRLLYNAIVPMTDRLNEEVARYEEGRAGRGKASIAYKYLSLMQTEQVAYITARAILTAAGEQLADVNTAMVITQRIEEAYRTDQLEDTAPALAHHMEKKAKQWTTSFHKRAIMRKAADIASVAGLSFEPSERVKLGMWLMRVFIEQTGLVTITTIMPGRKQCRNIIDYTPATKEWIARMHDRCELLEPRFLPMVTKPKDWTNPRDGGYLTSAARVCIVKDANPKVQERLASSDLSSVYEAINAIQSTPWRINQGVYSVLHGISERGETLGGLPPLDPLELPARPTTASDKNPSELSEAEQFEFNAWKTQAKQVHQLNAKNINKRIQLNARLQIAESLKDEEAIYFPHNMDWRGRVYPTPSTLSPQGCDTSKALLQFAEGKRLGSQGVAWLFIHVANLFGVDKVSLEDRITWTQENLDELVDSGLNPLDGARFWTQADSPWCALAACLELAGWSIAGEDYVSHLPIAMDGTCSGLQHFSAMLKDEVGGKAVNLIPSDKPSDIYTQVAELVETKLLGMTDVMSLAWRGHVTRKIVKQPCMTFAYSATVSGMQDQILMQLAKIGNEVFPGHSNWQMAKHLAKIVYEAICETVKRGAEAMSFIKETVKPASKAYNISWTTPDGLPVQQRYIKYRAKRVACFYEGSRQLVQIRLDEGKSHSQKHASSIAPNYVHSMDATHLRVVCRELSRQGLTSFAMIHDSFGVHACDVDLMNATLRDEFIAMYSVNVLEKFQQEIIAITPEESLAELPPVPTDGNLDLELVRESDFFFS